MTRIEKLLLAREPHLLTERDLKSLVLDVARLAGWSHYHTHDARRSPHGFPDLVLVGGPMSQKPRVIFAELKSEEGKLTDDQFDWLIRLARAGAETYTWRPSDWNLIVSVLTGREPR